MIRAARTSAAVVLLAALGGTDANASTTMSKHPMVAAKPPMAMSKHPMVATKHPMAMSKHPTSMPPMSGMHMTDAHGGLAASEQGYRLKLLTTSATTGTSLIRFEIVAPDGRPQKLYALDQTKRLHFYVVRDDLTGYQHVHPALGADGIWSIRLRFAAAGPYRLYADFIATDAKGMQHALVLSRRLHVRGDYRPAALPSASTTSTVDGYTVTLTGAPQAGHDSPLSFHVTQAGHPVDDLRLYLGTFAHMTAFKVHRLSYQHLHPFMPAGHPTRGGPDLAFTVDFASAGHYKLFLQFKHGGRLQLAQFVIDVT
jgi:hypothetical protein